MHFTLEDIFSPMTKEVRTRFAPSPTGGLHLGGVRTALYSYLFAKKNNGKFILRIEDTDQNRYVAGAEQYILNCLDWCGIQPDESPAQGGEYAPYRQSERKEMYKKYALKLVESGHAYLAFDTPEELEEMRQHKKTASNPSPQYDHQVRNHMKNSLRLLPAEVEALLASETPYVVRIKVPENEFISFDDLIRGPISNDSNLLDDKVLLKADGMPTYHLAVVVDDYLMKITHAFRGEEWLPSAPIHILLWKYLGWENEMPFWAHLPLILKPDGNGKLSKRDGDRLGFPIYAMDWTDPTSFEITKGFKEIGFLPQAFINMLAMLGWSSMEAKEIFSKEELIDKFSIERVHKAGAKFDYEKAKWYNHEWIKNTPAQELLPAVKFILMDAQLNISDEDYLLQVISLVKDRCILLNDFVTQASFFFKTPTSFDTEAVLQKWTIEKQQFFQELLPLFEMMTIWNATSIESVFKELSVAKQIKMGDLQMPFRVMLVGGKYGPAVFNIAEAIGKKETAARCQSMLNLIQ